MLGGLMNEMPYSHISNNGCLFISDRCDLSNGVTVTRPAGFSMAKFCADAAEFAGYHAVAILVKLKKFSGYDTIDHTIVDETD